jgi:hypothetical protein
MTEINQNRYATAGNSVTRTAENAGAATSQQSVIRSGDITELPSCSARGWRTIRSMASDLRTAPA